jgi:hypothetical protein
MKAMFDLLHGKRLYSVPNFFCLPHYLYATIGRRQSLQHSQIILGFGCEQSEIRDDNLPPNPADGRNLQTEVGIVPDMFESCNVKAPKLRKVPTASGTVPVKALPCNCKNVMLGNTPIPLILPVNKLSLISNWVNDERLNNSVVNVPVSSLKSKSMNVKAVNLPISVGMVDVNPPRSMPQICNMDNNPISVGIVPTKLFCSTHGKGSQAYSMRKH